MEFIINWHGGSLGPGYPNCQYALKYRLRFPVQNGRIISKFIKKLSKIAIFKFDMKPRQPKSIPKISKRRMLVLWDKFFVFGSVQKNIFDDFRSLKGKILIEMPKKREKSQFFHFEMAGLIRKLASNSLLPYSFIMTFSSKMEANRKNPSTTSGFTVIYMTQPRKLKILSY